jgi:hypothetical protein
MQAPCRGVDQPQPGSPTRDPSAEPIDSDPLSILAILDCREHGTVRGEVGGEGPAWREAVERGVGDVDGDRGRLQPAREPEIAGGALDDEPARHETNRADVASRVRVPSKVAQTSEICGAAPATQFDPSRDVHSSVTPRSPIVHTRDC